MSARKPVPTPGRAASGVGACGVGACGSAGLTPRAAGASAVTQALDERVPHLVGDQPGDVAAVADDLLDQ